LLATETDRLLQASPAPTEETSPDLNRAFCSVASLRARAKQSFVVLAPRDDAIKKPGIAPGL
jgi:hypothetical protein